MKLFSRHKQEPALAEQPPRRRTTGKERAQKFAEAEQRSRERWLRERGEEAAHRQATAEKHARERARRLHGDRTNGNKSKAGSTKRKPRSANFDPRRVLGVSAAAGTAEIKRAYRARCREYHPDLHPNDPVAEERFKQVQQARRLLV